MMLNKQHPPSSLVHRNEKQVFRDMMIGTCRNTTQITPDWDLRSGFGYTHDESDASSQLKNWTHFDDAVAKNVIQYQQTMGYQEEYNVMERNLHPDAHTCKSMPTMPSVLRMNQAYSMLSDPCPGEDSATDSHYEDDSIHSEISSSSNEESSSCASSDSAGSISNECGEGLSRYIPHTWRQWVTGEDAAQAPRYQTNSIVLQFKPLDVHSDVSYSSTSSESSFESSSLDSLENHNCFSANTKTRSPKTRISKGMRKRVTQSPSEGKLICDAPSTCLHRLIKPRVREKKRSASNKYARCRDQTMYYK